MSVKIRECNGVLYVQDGRYCYRRRKASNWHDAYWQMRGDSGRWFVCEIQRGATRKIAADFESCLRSYRYDEGPDYPRANKKSNVGAFFRKLQTKELYACTKGIFAPLKSMRYDATAENRARVNRECASITRCSGRIISQSEYDIRMAYTRNARTSAVLSAVLA